MPSDPVDPPPAATTRRKRARAPAPDRSGGEGLDAVAVAWGAWREFHPQARTLPGKAAALRIRGALAEAESSGYGIDDVAAVIRWAHLAPHERASYLRGPRYEAGKTATGDYLGVENLLRNATLATRVEWAREWIAAGSVDWRDAPAKVSATGEDADRAWTWIVKRLRGADRFPGVDDAGLGQQQRRAVAAAVACDLLRRWTTARESDIPFLERAWRAAWRDAPMPVAPAAQPDNVVYLGAR